VAVKEQDQASDGIGAATAVIQDLGEILITPLDDILGEGGKQIVEEGGRQVDFLHRVAEGEERSRRTAGRCPCPGG